MPKFFCSISSKQHTNTISFQVHVINRVSSAISVWTNAIVLFCILVDAMPSSYGCIIVPRAVVVPVQPELAVKLLVPVGHVREKAVVLVSLHVAIGALREQRTVGIVMIDLLHASALGNYHSIVSLMVLQIEIVGGAYRIIGTLLLLGT